eukprot:TRINITY_DN235_c0_g2_i1.p1 TRINITY_DN235_c0_g2~~TRINITY_DN235_c0_g2_i1.p1  ORF type:complete len:256 (-),score=41.46 TRINITY_DN235_c0_g2_i1:99-866(-)
MMEELISKASSVFEENASLISEINHAVSSSPLEFSTRFSYELHCLDWRLDLHAVPTTISAEEFVNGWRTNSRPLIQVQDVFGDCLDFRVETFADIERLNAAMMSVVLKFDLFGGSGVPVVRQFVANFELLRTLLVQLRAALAGGARDASSDPSIGTRLAAINRELASIRAALLSPPSPPVPDAIVQPPSAAAALEPSTCLTLRELDDMDEEAVIEWIRTVDPETYQARIEEAWGHQSEAEIREIAAFVLTRSCQR